jgi:DNA polymerase-3 subunit beta
MNTELSVEELIEPLQTVIGVVEKKQTLPILSHVLIQLSENTLTLTTTDMELEISASSKIKSSSEVTFTIYAKDLIDIVRKLPEKLKLSSKLKKTKFI